MTLSRATAGILGLPPLRSILIGSGFALVDSGGAALVDDAIVVATNRVATKKPLRRCDAKSVDIAKGRFGVGLTNSERQQSADDHLC